MTCQHNNYTAMEERMSHKFHSNIIFIDEELYEDYKNKKATFNN